MRRLIINADDFGYHTARNAAVIELLERGLLTSTTIILNQPESAAALAYAKSSGKPSFGLHLNLSEGRSMSGQGALEASRYRSLRGTPVLLSRSEFYAAEIEAQFRRAEEVFAPTHMDGHFHIHTYPVFWRPIVRALRAHGIRRVRRYFTHDVVPPRDGLSKRIAKKLFDLYFLHAAALRTTDFFYDVSYFLEHNERLIDMLPANCSIEIQTHPDSDGNRDYRLLTSAAYEKALRSFTLVSYADL